MHLPSWMDLSTWEDLWTAFVVTALFTIPAVIASHLRTNKKMNKHQASMTDLLDPTTPGGLGEIGHLKNSPEPLDNEAELG